MKVTMIWHRLFGAGGDPVDEALADLERQGAGMSKVAHLLAGLESKPAARYDEEGIHTLDLERSVRP